MSSRFGTIAASILHATGILALWRFLNRNSIVILMVHGTTPRRSGGSWMPLRKHIDPEDMDETIRFLQEHYRFISLQDAVDMLSGRKPVLPYCVVLTFDDGYRNNIKYGFPILERLNVPATYYVPTGHIDSRKPFWFDRIDYALQHTNPEGMEIHIGGNVLILSSNGRESLQENYQRIREALRNLPIDDRVIISAMEEFAERLEAKGGKRLTELSEKDDWTTLARWEEIRELSPDLITVGSHTADHFQLSLVDNESIRDQLVRSKNTIEKHTGRSCLHLCYPNGNFTSNVAKIATESGYESGVTVDEGLNRVGDDLMTLRRIPFPATKEKTKILVKVSGLSAAIDRTRNRIKAAFGGN